MSLYVAWLLPPSDPIRSAVLSGGGVGVCLVVGRNLPHNGLVPAIRCLGCQSSLAEPRRCWQSALPGNLPPGWGRHRLKIKPDSSWLVQTRGQWPRSGLVVCKGSEAWPELNPWESQGWPWPALPWKRRIEFSYRYFD